MGVVESSTGYGLEARQPLFSDAVLRRGSAASASEIPELPDQDECSICLGELVRAPLYSLQCGHTFHILCLASALQVSQHCPICRSLVQDATLHEVATELLAGQSQGGGGGGSTLAEELLMDLKARGNAPMQVPSSEETIRALQRAAKKGDASKVPSIAAILARTDAPKGKPASLSIVRIAAVEALRTLVPTFAATWPGLPACLSLLRGVATTDDQDEVRVAALRALKEVSRRGEEATLLAVRSIIEDQHASGDLKLSASDVLQCVALRGDECTMRVALAALKNADTSARSTGLRVLKSNCGPRGECAEFLDELVSAAMHPEAEVRALTMELLPQVEATGGSKGISIATRGLQDASEEVTVAALTALRRLWVAGSPEAVKTLVNCAIGGKHERTRVAALEALAQIADKGNSYATVAAAKLLKDPDSSVKLGAAQVLKRVGIRGNAEVCRILRGYLGAGDSEVRRMAVEALGIVGSRQDSATITALTKLEEKADDSDLQVAAAQALKQIR